MLICQSIKNSIAAKYYKIVEVFLYRELRDFWLRNYYSFFTSILSPFTFNVSKSARHAQSTWKYSMGTEDNLLLHSAMPIYWNVLNSLGLVYLSTIGMNSILLILFVRSMIS
jgi:hypothetical protein